MNITIIGAGIGGLTTALALKNANIPFKLYEATSEIKTVGAGIILAINALQVYRKFGVLDAIHKHGHPIHHIKLTNSSLSPILEVDLQDFEIQYQLQNHAIHRADLHNILYEAVGPEHIVLNKRLEHITQKNASYQLTFNDGSTLETMYLIGADGIHSKVREHLFPKTYLRDAKQLCWRGLTNVQSVKPNIAYEAWGKGKRFGFSKLNDKQMYWFLVANPDLATYNDDPRELVGDFHPLVQQIIDTTSKNTIITRDLYDLKPFDQWNINNACLVGDAAHATTPNLGQGACQAIEDAYILGELLKKHSIENAFKHYPDIRRKKAHFVVKRSWQLGKAAHLSNPIARNARNFVMKHLFTKRMNHKQMEYLFALDDLP